MARFTINVRNLPSLFLLAYFCLQNSAALGSCPEEKIRRVLDHGAADSLFPLNASTEKLITRSRQRLAPYGKNGRSAVILSRQDAHEVYDPSFVAYLDRLESEGIGIQIVGSSSSGTFRAGGDVDVVHAFSFRGDGTPESAILQRATAIATELDSPFVIDQAPSLILGVIGAREFKASANQAPMTPRSLLRFKTQPKGTVVIEEAVPGALEKFLAGEAWLMNVDTASPTDIFRAVYDVAAGHASHFSKAQEPKIVEALQELAAKKDPYIYHFIRLLDGRRLEEVVRNLFERNPPPKGMDVEHVIRYLKNSGR